MVTTSAQASCTVDTTTTFSGNSAVDGGAICAVNGSSLSFDGVFSFQDNAAIGDFQNANLTGFGGAVAIVSATATWNGAVTFTGNRAQNGGGALFFSKSNILWNVQTTTAFYNTAAVDGGVLYMFNTTATWNGQATMTFNNASVAGGALYMVASTVSWVGQTNVSSNVAGLIGGAALVGGSSVVTWSGDATFAENEVVWTKEGAGAGQGGAMVVVNSSVVWSGGRTQFIGNVVDGSGSALYLFDESHASWSGPMTIFVNNSASAWGALYVSESEASWSGETLFAGNDASSGGVVFVRRSYVGWTGETTYLSNEATVDGGAVPSPEFDSTYNPKESTLHIGATTTFLHNTSGANGGGVALLGACSLEVDTGVEVSYTRNSAAVAGGGVFVSGAGAGPAFSSALFVSNSAQVGGAVSTFGSGSSKSVSDIEPPNPTTFERCHFVGNRATTGGAIDSAAGHDSVVDSTFDDNTAGTGGALRLAGTASIDSCSFVENFSNDGGGAVVSNIGTISKMVNISFTGNGFNCPAGMFLDYNAVSSVLKCSSTSTNVASAWPNACLPRVASLKRAR